MLAERGLSSPLICGRPVAHNFYLTSLPFRDSRSISAKSRLEFEVAGRLAAGAIRFTWAHRHAVHGRMSAARSRMRRARGSAGPRARIRSATRILGSLWRADDCFFQQLPLLTRSARWSIRRRAPEHDRRAVLVYMEPFHEQGVPASVPPTMQKRGEISWQIQNLTNTVNYTGLTGRYIPDHRPS